MRPRHVATGAHIHDVIAMSEVVDLPCPIYRACIRQAWAMYSDGESGVLQDALQVRVEGAGSVPQAVSTSRELHKLARMVLPGARPVLAHVARQTHHYVSPNF